MKESRIEIALTESSEIKFMLNIPNEGIDVNVLKFGYINNVTLNLANQTLTVDFGVQYAYKDEPVLECRYAFLYSYKSPDEVELVVQTENGFNINNDLMNIILNVATGAIRGIMIARTAGTLLAKYPLPLLDSKTLMHTVKLRLAER